MPRRTQSELDNPRPPHCTTESTPRFSFQAPRAWVGYTAAVAGVALAAFLRWMLGEAVGQTLPPFITFYPVVIFAALLGGVGPGLLATGLSLVAVDLLFLQPTASLNISHPADQIAMALFCAINIAVSIVAGSLRSARARALAEADRASCSEQRYRSLFSSIDEGFCIIEVLFDEQHKPNDYRFLQTNPAFARQTGNVFAPGKTARECLPKLEERWFDLFGSVALTRQPRRYEDYVAATSAWYAGYAFPIGRPEQHQVGILFSDITSRKHAEDSLRKNEARLRLAIETAELGSYERDLLTNQVVANAICRKLFGVPEGALPPDVAYKAVHPADKQRVFAAVRRAFDPALREMCAAEFRILRPDGSVRWVAGRGRALFDDSVSPPRPVRFIGVLNDVTDRKLHEEALHEQARLAQLRADVVQTLQEPEPVQTLLQQTAALLVERFNAAFARIWTLDAAGTTLELQASAGLYTHLDGPHCRVPVGQLKIGRIARERRPLATNQVLGDPNIPGQDWARREGLVAFAGFPLLLEHRLLGVVALFSRHPLSQPALDTFEIISWNLAQGLGRLTAEQDLRAAKEALARANQELEHRVRQRTTKLRETVAELEGFSYSLVHDLRAPLRAMSCYASMLEQEAAPRLKPAESDLLRKLILATTRMDLLVTDSLNYSKVLRQDIPLGPVNLRTLLRGLVETYPNLQSPNAEISVEIADTIVYGNEALLTQVFSNLLGNAVKFVAPGVHPRVRLWAQPCPRTEGPTEANSDALPARPSLLVWVEDNGIGIPKEQQNKIFGIFQRLHRSDEYPGTGIGLAIVRKSLDRIGGQVCLDSEPGKGSRFCVQLPLAPQHQEALAA